MSLKQSKEEIIKVIQAFLEGNNHDFKYLVNVEVDHRSNIATCFVQPPESDFPEIKHVKYTPFIYIKDLKKNNFRLYSGDKELQLAKMSEHGITIKKMKTGKQPRLENGYPYKVTSTKSYQAIVDFFVEGGLNPYEKERDEYGKVIYEVRGKDKRAKFLFRDMFYLPKVNEQFFISTGIRLYKGIEHYDQVNRLTFDIETTGLRPKHHRVFQVGVKTTRGFNKVLEVDKENDDESEKKLIQDFFNLVHVLQPAVVCGFNSENFDYDFILTRVEILGMDIEKLPTTLNSDRNKYDPEKYEKKIQRRSATVKFGNSAEKYTATKIWGTSVIDIHHAAKRTEAVNTDIKSTKLKYICKFEKIAKKNRVYVDGKDNGIGKMWSENQIFIINPENNIYLKIPNNLQQIGKKLYLLQLNHEKKKINDAQKKVLRNKILNESNDFVNWVRENSKIYGNFKFIKGKDIVRQYLIDDLWETEQVDNLYNQSSFLLAKIIPTTYGRIATMGNAAVWNLLMTTWSYENDLAIPSPDVQENFSGGLARCFKRGYTKRLVKIDYASLYPMIQLTEDVFPIFDITGVIKKMLLYMTTTRNIYKKLATGDDLTEEEVSLLGTTDKDTYEKLRSGYVFTDEERNIFKVKQLPIKILNNSLFGALGSGFAFNWSDNVCAARITCTGRLHLRNAITWFNKYGCIPLLAVTDGINFHVPERTTIMVTDNDVMYDQPEGTIEEMWKYKGKVGITALIEKFNCDVKEQYEGVGSKRKRDNYISVDNDGFAESCLNLSRINYAQLVEKKDKKTNEMVRKIKLTGNSIKSKTMPKYIEEFIDKGLKMILEGKGHEFVECYFDYVEDIFYKRIPLTKIASKKKIKTSIEDYIKRGTDKNGRAKAQQAHMELLITERVALAKEIFKERYKTLVPDDKKKESMIDYTIEETLKYSSDYMPPAPTLDSYVYYVNVGTAKSHGDSSIINNPETGEKMFCSKLISNEDIEEKPDLLGEYNVDKYIDAFNKKVKPLLDGFDEEVKTKLLIKPKNVTMKDDNGNKFKRKILEKIEFDPETLVLKNFDHDDLNEAMFLEEKEIEYWNKTGYDPKLIWDGFKVPENNPLTPEIYEFKLKCVAKGLKEKMGIDSVKSVNDNLEKDDHILIKYGNIYHLGKFNGEFIEIVKEKLDLPLSPIELKQMEIQKEKDKELNKLREAEIEIQKNKDAETNHNILSGFLSHFNLVDTISQKLGYVPKVIEEVFTVLPDAKIAYERYLYEHVEKHEEPLHAEYIEDYDD